MGEWVYLARIRYINSSYMTGNDRGVDITGESRVDPYTIGSRGWETAVVLASLEGWAIVRKLFVLVTCLGEGNAKFGKIAVSYR